MTRYTIDIMDASFFEFEKKSYDTIILDPPYINIFSKDKMGEKSGIHKEVNQACWFPDYAVAKIMDRAFQYAYKNDTWLVVFNNRPLFLSRYVLIWLKSKSGMGYTIGRNIEYIHLINYRGMSISTLMKGMISEGLFIERQYDRPANKPIELYEKIFVALKSKRVLDLFAGWANSVISAKRLGISIDAIDKDENLKRRYEYLREYEYKHQSSLDDL